MAKKMTRAEKHLLFVVFFVLVTVALIFFLVILPKVHLERSYFESVTKTHTELEQGESGFIVLENTIKADICIICQGYRSENYFSSCINDIEIDQKTSQRIANKIPLKDGFYLVFIKNRKVVLVSRLDTYYSSPMVYDQGNKALIGKDVLAAKIGGNIKISVRKLKAEQPLLITGIE